MKYFLDNEEVTLEQLKKEMEEWEWHRLYFSGCIDRRTTLNYIGEDCMYFYREEFGEED